MLLMFDERGESVHPRGMNNWPANMRRHRVAQLRASLAVLATILTLPADGKTASPSLSVMSVEARPLSSSDPKESGLTLELVAEAARRADLSTQVKFIPWRRAQEMVSGGTDLLITPLARTQEREDRYTWIARLYRLERVLATLDKQINNLQEALAERRIILVGAGTAQEQLLRSSGYPSELILTAKVGEREIDLLLNGRAQAWLNSSLESRWRWHQAQRSERLIIGEPIQNDDIYLACSRQCSANLVARLQRAFETMARDGTTDRLLDRYTGGS
jgi:polar amino acid transport system substrate-binding protein